MILILPVPTSCQMHNSTIMSEALLQQYATAVISIAVAVSHDDPGTIADNF